MTKVNFTFYVITIITAVLFISFLSIQPSTVFAKNFVVPVPPPSFKQVNITDNNFKAQLLIAGLVKPPSMTFLGNDILVNELETGHVRHFNKQFVEMPLALDLSKTVAFLNGITSTGKTVYIYATENSTNSTGSVITKNVVFKYDWNGKALVNQTTVKILGGGLHNGGVFATSNNGTIFTINGDAYEKKLGPTQNQPKGKLDDTSVVVTINKPNNIVVPSSALNPLDQYYAIGIRNSFGIAIDPVTDKLWETENGPNSDDEINLVYPKFNNGATPIYGFATPQKIASLPNIGFTYHDPIFDWQDTICPTGIVFMTSSTFAKYSDNAIVGSCEEGEIFHFKLNSTRTGFVFQNPVLQTGYDPIGTNDTEMDFAKGFNEVVGLVQGPDGFLYVVDISNAAIYRIMPASQTPPDLIHSFNATILSGTQVKLTWNKPQDGGSIVTNYNVYRNVNNGGFKFLKSISGATSTSYTDTTLSLGSTVKYGVAAVSSIGSAPFEFSKVIKLPTS